MDYVRAYALLFGEGYKGWGSQPYANLPGAVEYSYRCVQPNGKPLAPGLQVAMEKIMTKLGVEDYRLSGYGQPKQYISMPTATFKAKLQARMEADGPGNLCHDPDGKGELLLTNNIDALLEYRMREALLRPERQEWIGYESFDGRRYERVVPLEHFTAGDLPVSEMELKIFCTTVLRQECNSYGDSNIMQRDGEVVITLTEAMFEKLQQQRGPGKLISKVMPLHRVKSVDGIGQDAGRQ